MAKATNGSLFFESAEADDAAAQRGAGAAKAFLEGENVEVRIALEAYKERNEELEAVLLWEQGKGEYPVGEPDEDLCRLADIAEEAWAAAIDAAGVSSGEIGFVPH